MRFAPRDAPMARDRAESAPIEWDPARLLASLERVDTLAQEAAQLRAESLHHLAQALPSRALDRKTSRGSFAPLAGLIRRRLWHLPWASPLRALHKRIHWPTLLALNEIRPLDGVAGGWESTGSDPQLAFQAPLPRGWVRFRIRGYAHPAANLVLYLDHGTGMTEGAARRIGVLTGRPREIHILVPFGRAIGARLDPGAGQGRVVIEELELREVTRFSVLMSALMLGMRYRRGDEKSWVWLAHRTICIVRSSGIRGLRQALATQLYRHLSLSDYALWQEQQSVDEPANLAKRSFAYRPLISLIVPVYNVAEPWLRRCVESVRAQLYDNWELCLVDDASTRRHVRTVLNEYATLDPRIRVIFRLKNGHICQASNDALEIANGEFVGLLDHDDEIVPEALYEVVSVLNEHPDADLIYSDEDKIDENGQRHSPYFKPDWSPETLLNHMYTGHLSVYRRSLIEAAGRFREGYEGSQDHDLVLRVAELTSRVVHIPRVLYHWRTLAGSAAGAVDVKPYTAQATIRALRDALLRRGIRGQVGSTPNFPDRFIVTYIPDLSRKVSIIIPTRDQAGLLGRCIESIVRQTTHPNFDICVVDNDSVEEETATLFRDWSQRLGSRFLVVREPGAFNFARSVNRGVQATDGELVLLLNNDTEVLQPDWLNNLAGFAERPDLGAIGCKLLYPNGTIQHGGVVLMRGGVGGHAHAGLAAESPGYFGRMLAAANCAAVTAACLMVRRDAFTAVGGFDTDLAVAFNDVDFCLRIQRMGLRNVCLGNVRLLHHESASRGPDYLPEKQARFNSEVQIMRSRWSALLDADPFYSPHLRQNPVDFGIAVH
jgi:glycosyltransferase involved in cell wall biosynthesis